MPANRQIPVHLFDRKLDFPLSVLPDKLTEIPILKPVNIHTLSAVADPTANKYSRCACYAPEYSMFLLKFAVLHFSELLNHPQEVLLFQTAVRFPFHTANRDLPESFLLHRCHSTDRLASHNESECCIVAETASSCVMQKFFVLPVQSFHIFSEKCHEFPSGEWAVSP